MKERHRITGCDGFNLKCLCELNQMKMAGGPRDGLV